MSSIKIINDDVKFPVLLDSSVYTQWRKHVKTYLPKFGQAGKALLTGKRDEPVYPTPTDMVLNAAGQPTLILFMMVLELWYLPLNLLAMD